MKQKIDASCEVVAEWLRRQTRNLLGSIHAVYDIFYNFENHIIK